MRVSRTFVVVVCFVLAVPVFAASANKSQATQAIVTYDALQPEAAVSYSFGVSNSASDSTGGGGGAGKPTLTDFTFVKRFNSQSPTLFKDCATGKHIPVVTLRLLDDKGNVLAEIKLSDVLVKSYHTTSNGADFLDSISLTFAKIDFVKVLIGL